MRTLDTTEQDRSSRTAAEWLWPLLPIGVSVFCLSALIYFHLYHDVVDVRSALQVVIAGLYRTIGLAPAVLFFLLVLTWSSIWFVTGQLDRPLARSGRLVAMAVMLGVFLNLGDGGVTAAFHKGELGAWLAERLIGAFGYYPSLVLVWGVTFASLLLATDFFFSDSFERLRQRPAPVESGVETAVADHLRGLASMTAGDASMGPSVATAPPVPAARAPVVVDTDASAAAPPASPVPPDFAAFATEAEPPPAPTRRPSYFERRRELERTAAAPAEAVKRDEEWVPMAPDNQEIDDPETEAPSARRSGVPPAGAPLQDAQAPAADDLLQFAASVEDRPLDSDEPDPAATDDLADADAGAAPVAAVGSAPEEGRLAELPRSELEAEGSSAEAGDESQAGASAPPTEASLAEGAEVLGAAIGATGAVDERAGDPAEPDAVREPIVQIPRPDPAARATPAPASHPSVAHPPRDETPAVRQQGLFDAGVDDALVQEAVELLTGARRVTASLLQRRLRIDYPRALELMAQLAARGIVELEADASQGRVVV